MRQVDTCDFCGDAPDGVFEVVPAAVPDGPVRLALCTDCQSTLETVVDPLLAAGRDADDGASDDDTRDSEDDNDDGAAEADESTARTADSTAASAEPADEATATVADASDDDDDDPDADAGGGRTDGETREDDAGGDGDSDDGDGITIEQQGGDTPAGRRPDGYAQVLRLLENRAGGMPRSDLRSLATNAYGLTDAAFEAAVEAAIENGDVTEASDGLRRT